MSATIALFTIVVRSSAGAEFDLGTISVDQSDSSSTVKHALASMLSAIATELASNAYDGPTAPMPWLDNVDLVEFTDSVPRSRSYRTRSGRCGALPARAFRGRYPEGCVAAEGHEGSHCTDEALVSRNERRLAVMTANPILQN